MNAQRLIAAGTGLALAMLTTTAAAAPFGTFDPRSQAMGGAGVAAGNSGNAGFFNPALLGVARDGDRFSVEFPIASVRLSDRDNFRDDLDDIQDEERIENFEAALGAYATACSPFPATCDGSEQEAQDLVNTGNALRGSMQNIDDSLIEGEAFAGTVIGVPGERFAMSVHASARVVAGGILDITEEDLNNILAVTDAAQDGDSVNPDTVDELTSRARILGAGIQEVGVSIGRNFGQFSLGVTPKVQKIETFDFNERIEDAETEDFDERTTDQTRINVDIGAVYDITPALRTGLVAKNVFSRTVRTVDDNPIDLDPQLRAGIAWAPNGSVTVAADLDLLENDPIGQEDATRILGFGAEYNLGGNVQVRGGYRTNLSETGQDMFTAGLGFSPFGMHIDLAAMYRDSDDLGAGAQFGFRF